MGRTRWSTSGGAGLVSKAEAARRLGVSPNTIGDLVRRLGIVTRPIPASTGADGLDHQAFRLIQRRLRPPAGRRALRACAGAD